MRVVSWRGMYLPGQVAKHHIPAWRQKPVETKAGTHLPGRAITQCILIPDLHQRCLARWDQGARHGIALLQRRVAAAVVAVQMRIQRKVEGSIAQCGLDQRQGLCGVRGVASVDQGGFVTTDQEDVVGREPPALENLELRRQSRGCAQTVAPGRSWRRRIFPTFVFGRLSLNSMCFGRL